MSTQVEDNKESSGARSRWLPAAAALVVVAGVAAAFAFGGDNDTPSASAEPLTLSAGSNDSMAMCIQFSLEELASAEVAFEGTVTSSQGSIAELDVDQWFKGGDAERVVIEAPGGELVALIGGFPLEAGEAYLITAYQGTVKYCGFSGPATPEFRTAFQSAFGG